MSDANQPAPPDLTKGIAADAVATGGMLVSRAGEDDVLLARAGDKSPSARIVRTAAALS
jgi:hypothetical protein